MFVDGAVRVVRILADVRAAHRSGHREEIRGVIGDSSLSPLSSIVRRFRSVSSLCPLCDLILSCHVPLNSLLFSRNLRFN